MRKACLIKNILKPIYSLTALRFRLVKRKLFTIFRLSM